MAAQRKRPGAREYVVRYEEKRRKGVERGSMLDEMTWQWWTDWLNGFSDNRDRAGRHTLAGACKVARALRQILRVEGDKGTIRVVHRVKVRYVPDLLDEEDRDEP
jgi:hypothetical protein